MSAIAAFLGRLMLALLFVLAGIPKIIDPSGAAAMLEGAGLPGSLAMPTGVFEVVAGLLLALGFMTRLVSILLAGFVCAQALLGPARPPEPPATRVAAAATVRDLGDLADASTNCARAPRELRFEMITAETEAYPPAGREAVVCLAVYQPDTD